MEYLEKIVSEKAMQRVSEKGDLVVAEDQKATSFDGLQSEYFKKQVESGKDINEIATDFVKASTTSQIMKNENGEFSALHKELADEQKQTIKESFKQDRVEQQAKTLTAKQQKAEAFYISFRPILEFDFSPLIHKKDKEFKVEKTYKDRSYGIPLMVLMLTLFMLPYCVFSIVLAFFNGLNSICEAIATFSKVARVIAISIFVIIMGVLFIYFAMLGIDALFNTNIVESIKR
jgi:hypothetical protein